MVDPVAGQLGQLPKVPAQRLGGSPATWVPMHAFLPQHCVLVFILCACFKPLSTKAHFGSMCELVNWLDDTTLVTSVSPVPGCLPIGSSTYRTAPHGDLKSVR